MEIINLSTPNKNVSLFSHVVKKKLTIWLNQFLFLYLKTPCQNLCSSIFLMMIFNMWDALKNEPTLKKLVFKNNIFWAENENACWMRLNFKYFKNTKSKPKFWNLDPLWRLDYQLLENKNCFLYRMYVLETKRNF